MAYKSVKPTYKCSQLIRKGMILSESWKALYRALRESYSLTTKVYQSSTIQQTPSRVPLPSIQVKSSFSSHPTVAPKSLNNLNFSHASTYIFTMHLYHDFVLCNVGMFSSHTPNCELPVSFRIPCLYGSLTNLCRQNFH